MKVVILLLLVSLYVISGEGSSTFIPLEGVSSDIVSPMSVVWKHRKNPIIVWWNDDYGNDYESTLKWKWVGDDYVPKTRRTHDDDIRILYEIRRVARRQSIKGNHNVLTSEEVHY